MKSQCNLKGWVVAELRGPDGALKQRSETHNLVTDVGDALAASSIYSAARSGWGMKLGTDSTAAAKNSTGSYITTATYVSGSAKALDDSTPKQGASANIVQFRRLWAAGEGTADGIRRVSIVDNTTDAGEDDATHTFAISVFSADINKAAGDTLTVTWNVTFTGE